MQLHSFNRMHVSPGILRGFKFTKSSYSFPYGTGLMRNSVLRYRSSRRPNSTSAVQTPGRLYKKRYIILSAASVSLTLLYFTNEDFRAGIRHAYNATSRVKAVTVACYRCFNLYYKTLNGKYVNDEDYNTALTQCHKACALITRKAIEKNGGIYIKLGQHISALTYIFPPEWTDTMIPLQDRCPVSSFETVKQLVAKDTGKSIEDWFESFDEVPLGTASLAQVHGAVLKDTHEPVAVKVQHPSLAEFVPLDVLMTRTVFNLIDYFFPQYPLAWLSDELQQSIYVELDFRKEAENAIKTQEYFSNFYDETALRVPNVIRADKRLLIMEYLGGGRPDDLKFLREHNISTAELSSCFAHIFNNMIFTPGVGLHCDPHPGNIAIRPLKHKRGSHNFEIILYDHGLYRDVPTDIRRSYAHFWLALMNGNSDDMRKYAKEFAHIGDDDFQLFSAAITGRDYENATNTSSPRSEEEISNMTSSFSQEGFFSQVMRLLHKMPRIVLLILKTNDLTRNLDEKLESPLGVTRTFLIMGVYCARTVYDEGQEKIRKQFKEQWSLARVFAEFTNWWGYFSIRAKLNIYDCGLWIKSIAGYNV